MTPVGFGSSQEILNWIQQPLDVHDPIRAGLSTGRLLAGIGLTAMGALSATKNGQAIPIVIQDIFAPIR